MADTYALQIAYDAAWHYAAKAHRNQCLPGTDLPYLTHIGWVAGEILITLHYESVETPTLAIQCAILHATLEDTDTDHDDLRHRFGQAVADGVAALTKNAALPKNQRMQDSLERILAQPAEVAMVKLADRIANLRKPPGFWDAGKIAAYIEESVLIIDSLGSTSTYLSNRIQARLKAYSAKRVGS